MYGLRIFLSALLFSLALGPHVMLLHAQTTENRPDNDVSTESAVTANHTEDATITVEIVDSTDPITVPKSSTISSKDMPTEPLTAYSKELSTTAEPPVTTVITTTMRTTIMMTTTIMEPSTAKATESADLETTPELLKDTTAAHNVITTVHTLPRAIQTSAPTTVHKSTKASETTSILIMTTEEIEETTPSTPEITDIIPTLPPIFPSSDPTDINTKDTEEPITSTSVIVSTSSEAIEPVIGNGGTGSEKTVQDSNWLLYIIIAVAIICIASAFCVIIFVRRKKKTRSQRFGSGYMNNQRSKKKKGEEDAWAGPVNLEGGDKAECEGPEELGQGGNKHPDGTDLTLSTFVASEANGGVGRPGSMEAQKWEEQEPLLYIDEDAKAEAKDKQNEKVEKEKEVGQKEEEDANGKTEMKEVKQNGGEAFCLTTAV